MKIEMQNKLQEALRLLQEANDLIEEVSKNTSGKNAERDKTALETAHEEIGNQWSEIDAIIDVRYS